jgi:hypothetical protein
MGALAVRMMDEAEFAALFSDSDVGAEPPFGSLYGLPVLLDRSLAHAGPLILRGGSHEEALELALRSAGLAETARSRWLQANSLALAAEFALVLGRPTQAEEICLRTLPIARQIGDRQRIAYLLTLLAWTAAELGQPRRAGRLWAAIETEGADRPFGQWEAERESYRTHVDVAAGPEFERGLHEGRTLTFDEAIESALAGDQGSGAI